MISIILKMQKEFLSYVAILVVAFLYLGFQQSFANSEGKDMADIKDNNEEWTLNTSLGFPFWIVLNFEAKTEVFPRRSLFLLIRDQEFNETNLRRIFTKLASDYPDPENLFIIACSDENRIRQVARQHTSQVICIRFPDTQEATNNPGLWSGQKSFGYYRSHYVRVGGEEWFAHSPDPKEADLVITIIKERRLSYTGEVNSDLLLAIREGDAKQALEILTKGVEVNAKDERGQTALMLATLRNLREVVGVLLARRADVNSRSSDGSTALIYASANGDLRIVKELLESGADVNAQAKDGYTPLIVASSNGHVDVIKLLLIRGADINMKTNRGRTALSLAKANAHTEACRLLNSAGATE